MTAGCYNKTMLFVALFQWWYTAGWVTVAKRLQRRVVGVLQMFSVGALIRSLFAPFRETFNEHPSSGSMDVRLRAWADLQISRGIGAMIRGVVIIGGLLSALVAGVVALVVLLAWPLLPALPLIAVLLMGVV